MTLPGCPAVTDVVNSTNAVVWLQEAPFLGAGLFPGPDAPLAGKWLPYPHAREKGLLLPGEWAGRGGLQAGFPQQSWRSQGQVTAGCHIQTGPRLSSAHPGSKQNRQLFGKAVCFHPASSFLS